ncbi:MAG: phage tail tape measure protein [Lachnospiraceae bacterium]|nr:phage tail tape measure protein [Lachnospiraceae bacterium]
MADGKVVIKIVGDIADFEKKLSAIGNSAESALGKLGSSLTKTGVGMTAAITTPTMALGTAAVKVGMDFESSLSQVQAISGATAEDMVRLEEKAVEMGAKTKFSLSESADAFKYMAMAGWDTEQMLNGIEGIMSLAAADGLDLATTSDIVTDALTGFGLTAQDSAHFADVLARASSSANTNVAMLGESFKYIAPVAGTLGYSPEDTAIALGLMANAGIKSSQAGTSLRASLSAMIKPSDTAAGIMEKYGISISNTDGTMKSLGEVMVILREKFSGMTQEEQAFAASAIFGREAMSGMMAIINASDEDFKKLTDAVYNCGGTAENMANTQLDNLSGQITILKSTLEVLAYQISETLLPYLKQFAEWLQNLLNWFISLDGETQQNILKWIGIAAAVGPVLVIFGTLCSSISNIISLFSGVGSAISTVGGLFTNLSGVGSSLAGLFSGALSAAGTALSSVFTFLCSPAGLVVAAIAAIIAIGVLLWQNWDTVKEYAVKIWTAIKDFFNNTWNSISDTASKIWNGLKDFFSRTWTSISNFASSIWNGIKNTLSSIWNGIRDICSSIWNGISGFVTNSWNNISALTTSIWNGISGFLSSVWGSIKNLALTVWNGIGSAANSVWNGIQNTAVNVWNNIAGFLNNSWTNITNTIKNVWGNIKVFLTSTWENIKDGAWNGIQNIGNTIWNAFQGVISGVWNLGKQVVTGFWNGITGAAGWLKDKVTGFFGDVIGWGKEALGINSPSKEFMYLGQMSAVGYDDSLASGMKTAKEHLKRDINNLLQTAKSKTQAVLNFATPNTSFAKTNETTNYITNHKGIVQNFYSQTTSPYDAYRRAVINAY